jgi:uncharacterized protein YqgV (UPF0045/DUF77 family)
MPKLAEALVERKGLQEKLNRLFVRIAANVKVQEGEPPDEDPAGLIAEAQNILAEMKQLTMQINVTNMQTVIPGSTDGTTLMQAIAERDRLSAERKLLEHTVNAARIEPNRAYGVTRNEVKWKSTISVSDLQGQIDAVSKSYRLLDTRIQEANWLTDLIQN